MSNASGYRVAVVGVSGCHEWRREATVSKAPLKSGLRSTPSVGSKRRFAISSKIAVRFRSRQTSATRRRSRGNDQAWTSTFR